MFSSIYIIHLARKEWLMSFLVENIYIYIHLYSLVSETKRLKCSRTIIHFVQRCRPRKKPTLTSRTGDECVIPLLAINTHALLESNVIRMHFKFEQCKFDCSNVVFILFCQKLLPEFNQPHGVHLPFEL